MYKGKSIILGHHLMLDFLPSRALIACSALTSIWLHLRSLPSE
jgi:hypothetical protein